MRPPKHKIRLVLLVAAVAGVVLIVVLAESLRPRTDPTTVEVRRLLEASDRDMDPGEALEGRS